MQNATSLPRGWFRAALSNEVGAKQPRSLRILGRDLVVFRDRNGTARIVDAYCPHLGAHLGDGTVDAGRLRCPFHGWCFDGEGRCVEVPFAKKIPPRAELGRWPTREVDGVIFIWHGAGEPEFPVPRVPELATDEWSQPLTWRRHVRGCFTDLKENIVDRAHFPSLHDPFWRRFIAPPRIVETIVEPTHFGVAMEATISLFGLEVGTQFRFDLHGPGVEVVRVATPSRILMRFLSTPVDAENIDFFALVYAPRLPVPGVTALLRRAYIASVTNDVERDIRIWERKRYIERPILSDADGPIIAMRRWLARFSDAQLSDATAHGAIVAATDLLHGRSPSSA
jgi:nitrite reductase/ring-hydroxylating ferredoxin subunit